MSTSEIEVRLSALEREIATLKRKVDKGDGTDKPWWQNISGKFSESENFEEAERIGREYRKNLRETVGE